MTRLGPPAVISCGICDSGQFSIDMISAKLRVVSGGERVRGSRRALSSFDTLSRLSLTERGAQGQLEGKVLQAGVVVEVERLERVDVACKWKGSETTQ